MNELTNSFLEEAHELISELEDSLLTLEERPTDKDAVHLVFRVMHTLKGSGGMFGFHSVTNFTHHLENIYYKIRNGELSLSKEILTLTLLSVDLIKELLKSPDEIPHNIQLQYNDLVGRIKSVTQGTDIGKTDIDAEAITQLKRDQANRIKTFYIHFEPNLNILKNGTNPIYLIDELIALGDSYVILKTENIPEISELKVNDCYVSWEIILSTTVETGDIMDVFIFVEEDSMIEIEELALFNLLKFAEFLNAIENTELQKRLVNLPELEKIAQNILTENPELLEIKASDTEAMKTTSSKGEDEKSEDSTIAPYSSAPILSSMQAVTSSIRVSNKKIESLMNLVSELVTSQARLNVLAEEIQSPDLTDAVENLEKLTRQLRDNAFDISLIPIESMLTRFKRLIRDLSTEVNKEVNFFAEGADTELDKTIIENLSDPLMHIFRNAIDHGIENKEIRKSQGKPEIGRITLKAFYSGTFVYIQISDDGAGIDPQIIRKKAIQKGLIRPDSVLSENEITELITLPGFSTATSITDISGRGVGMDVVLKNIQKIQGELLIESKLGVGTTFTLKLPLTLSIIDGLIVYIEDTPYIIPLTVINKVRPLEHVIIEKAFNNTLVVDNEQLPFVYLRQHFGIATTPPENELMIVVNFENQRMGIIIDRVEKQSQVVVKSMGKQFHHQDIISGVSIMGNGKIALVLDTNKIINSINKIIQSNK